ncbi:MAG TPA: alpha-amylase family glycosyl hydrolase [Mycobacteriales bacterium]|nr:alpha-amylase family glycosyl hydrolase [Mycobacteriales bacterium]
MHRSPDNPAGAGSAAAWWRDAVFYQVYLRSFADGDGDGVGDLAGLRERLDYANLLGVDALWLSPFYPSPMVDNGYDVADPRGIDPLFGDLAQFDEFMVDAHRSGLKILLDVVPNHSSDQHPWFVEALASEPGSPARRRYHFRDGRGGDGATPPNNWQSVFGGPAWTRVPDGQWYLHLFAPEQPDLNWANEQVWADFQKTLRFWLDRGVDGIRIDVGHGMAKPEGLPDAAAATGTELLADEQSDPRFDDDGVHDIHRMIRRVLDGYPARMAIGEVWVQDPDRLARYVRPDELHQVFNFALLKAPWDAAAFTRAITDSITAMNAAGSAPSWALSNHDTERQVTRYGGGERGVRRARAAALLQLALPGSCYVYAGDELGLADVEIPPDAIQDPIWERSGHERHRDGARVPLPWSGEKPPYGFSPAESTWLPMPENWGSTTIEAQLEDPGSMLSLYREAVELRHTRPEFSGADVQWYGAPEGCLAFRRDGGLVCALNASANPVPVPRGSVILSSVPLEDGKLPTDAAVWLVPEA